MKKILKQNENIANIFSLKKSNVKTTSIRYPSMDGLRGISIILVVLFHFNVWNYGALGVNIFFVISGFLITIINLKEYHETGSISLKKFYQRRVLRILPLLYLYLIVVVILNFIYHLDISKINILGAMAFLLDFSYFRSHYFTWFTGHLWSLAVEEQFYLFIPLIFKFNYKLFVSTIFFIIIILPIICLLQNYFQAINYGIPYYFTHFLIKFQSIAVGCLIAILTFNGYLNYKFSFWGNSIINFIAIFIIFYINYDPFFTIDAVFKNLLVDILIAYILVTNISTNNSILYKILNTSILSFIGVISYSIYMWNPIFTSGEKKLPLIFNYAPISIPLLLIISTASYFLYEKKFLKLKSKYKLSPTH